MAAIDKYYTSDRDEAKRLFEFCKNAGDVYVTTLDGVDYTFNPLDYWYYKSPDDFPPADERSEFALWNSPTYMDYWLWENCKEKRVLDDIEWKYDLKGKTEVSGKDFGVIGDPDMTLSSKFKVTSPIHNWFFFSTSNKIRRMDKTFRGRLWDMEVSGMGWCDKTNKFIPYTLMWTCFERSDAFRFTSKRGFLKKVSKWLAKNPLPSGSKVTFTGPYVGQTIEMEII